MGPHKCATTGEKKRPKYNSFGSTLLAWDNGIHTQTFISSQLMLNPFMLGDISRSVVWNKFLF